MQRYAKATRHRLPLASGCGWGPACSGVRSPSNLVDTLRLYLGRALYSPILFTVYRKSVSVSFYFLLLGYILTTDHALGERRGRNMVLPSQSLYLALLSLLRDTRIAGAISGLPADTRFAAPLSVRSAQRIGHQLL